ncbi:MAG: hypothetical protein ACSHYF_03220 [Verrucomicrobiaceae bacterium]
MKVKYILVIFILMSGSGLLCLFLGKGLRSDPVNQPELNRGVISPTTEQHLVSSGNPLMKLHPTGDELKAMFETPVEVYGQVLDQNNDPVIGAEIGCSWPYMSTQEVKLTLRSAAPDGLFEVVGLKNKVSVTISVEPPAGYRDLRTQNSRKRIQIAQPPKRITEMPKYRTLTSEQKELLMISEAYKPDKRNPIIFRLEKLGEIDALFHKDHTHRNHTFGEVRYLSLEGIGEGSKDYPVNDYCLGFSFSLNKEEKLAYDRDPRSSPQYSWSVKLLVPEGGIQLLPGDFTRTRSNEVFSGKELAPETGYQKELLLSYPKDLGAAQWKSGLRTGCFIRFKDGTYARVVINANISIVSIKSYYNPTGSRNLVFDHHKRIKE